MYYMQLIIAYQTGRLVIQITLDAHFRAKVGRWIF